MRQVIHGLIILLLLSGCDKKPDVSIVPKPASIQISSNYLLLDEPVQILGPDTPTGNRLKGLASQSLTDHGLTTVDYGKKTITMKITSYDTLVPEGFHRIMVDESGVLLESNSEVGLFYALQTLNQLLPSGEGQRKIQGMTIVDYPRFPYRGLHLDVGRHFFPVSFIKQYIDWMAFHKFNYFHWHLTEDQGWRIEIKKYPKLQEVAAFRKETLIGHAGIPEKFDRQPYGGFYTQEEIKEVVQYAAERFVTIIPEIEMPGHSLAALSAYPSLGCTGGPYEVGTKWGVFPDVFCAGKEESFEFLQNVLDEVITLFPGSYIHIGGDECPKSRWKVCPDCQKRIKAVGLKDEHELQSYFIQRIEKYMNSKGRQIIGWDEILEGGLAPNATVMSWRGEAGGIAAAKQNHDVIMTPGDWCYFDHYQDTTANEPLAIGGYTPVRQVYEYEPIPSVLSTDESMHILGAQANLWTEYITTPEHAAYMVYPRACALAEVVWSPKSSRNYPDFLVRMKAHLVRLEKMSIPYASHIQKEMKP